MKHQNSHNTLNHHRGIHLALSFLTVPRVSFGVQDSLGEISLSQLQKFLHQVAGRRNHSPPVHPRGRNGHPQQQVHLACLQHRFLDKVPCRLEVTTSPPPGERWWGEMSSRSGTAGSYRWRVGTHRAVMGTKGSVRPTRLFWVLAQSGGELLTEPVGNQSEHLESRSELKPPVFTQLDVSWVTREYLQSIFHFTVRGGFFRAERFLVSLSICPVSQEAHVGKHVPSGSPGNPIGGATPTQVKMILSGASLAHRTFS